MLILPQLFLRGEKKVYMRIIPLKCTNKSGKCLVSKYAVVVKSWMYKTALPGLHLTSKSARKPDTFSPRFSASQYLYERISSNPALAKTALWFSREGKKNPTTKGVLSQLKIKPYLRKFRTITSRRTTQNFNSYTGPLESWTELCSWKA